MARCLGIILLIFLVRVADLEAKIAQANQPLRANGELALEERSAVQARSILVSFLDIRVRSEGCDDPGKAGGCGIAYIIVNGNDYSPHSRGHNVVVVDAKTGTVLGSKWFDTYGVSSSGTALRDYLNAINGDKIVLVAIQDAGSTYISPAFGALKRLGAVDPILTDFRGSFSLIGYAQPSKPSWIAQEQQKRYEGPSEIFLRIPLMQSRQPRKNLLMFGFYVIGSDGSRTSRVSKL
ncbi:uncharacterized protein LOC110040396 isoform X2 [Orbicella faveolata]|nr:uncharacterized protein LOC110040396 isoform X2 [Orbicella faveolata]